MVVSELEPGRRSGWGATLPCSGSRSSPRSPPAHNWFSGRRRSRQRQQQKCNWEQDTILCLGLGQEPVSSSATRKAARGRGPRRRAGRCRWGAFPLCTETNIKKPLWLDFLECTWGHLRLTRPSWISIRTYFWRQFRQNWWPQFLSSTN